MKRGRLRVYLGMAPGVGKTFAMLDEARRRLDRGTDVVVAVVETHGRAHTAERLEGLEVVPRRMTAYRGTSFAELDLEAVLARRPAVALVDELAHTNLPGGRHEKRWQDVDELLDAGIDVITTVNIQHLESLNDVVRQISGVEQRETIPDEVVRRADQIEIVDISPEALRRRMAHGNVYPSERVDAALSHYFRIGNLSALRELALLWVAERVDEGLQRYRAEHGIEQAWEARERIVVALPGGAEGETLLRRAARIAARTTGAELLALHVVRGDGLADVDPAELGRQRHLAEQMGGSWHQVVGDDVATALLDFARVENATQIVLGASSRGRWETFLTGEGVGARVTRLSGKIDVHLVTHEAATGGGSALPVAGLTTALSLRRRLQGAVLGVVALLLLTFLLSRVRSELNLPSDILLYLAVVIAVALVGGLWPALGAAVAGSLLLNYYFTPPLYTFTISDKNNALALLVFVAVAALVSLLVERVVRRTTEAGRAQAEAAILAGLAGGVLRGETSLEQILARARETFSLTSVELLERGDGSSDEDEGWTSLARAGSGKAGPVADLPVGPRLRLRVEGTVRAPDQRLLTAFAAQAAVVRERAELADRAAEAAVVAEADRTRAALLTAVSHDLRSPLASAKASVTSLRSDRVRWSDEAREELLETADESLDRLTRLIENLLDLSRLEAGALAVALAPVALDELVPVVLDSLDPGAVVRVDVPETLPEVYADPVLLERVLVNLLTNALRYSPAGTSPLLAASCHAGSAEIRVVDRGPGVPLDQRERMFAPFQRLGDRDSSTGVGLGLALAQGLSLAMGGSLTADDTPGGGLTMTVTLPLLGTGAGS